MDHTDLRTIAVCDDYFVFRLHQISDRVSSLSDRFLLFRKCFAEGAVSQSNHYFFIGH